MGAVFKIHRKGDYEILNIITKMKNYYQEYQHNKEINLLKSMSFRDFIEALVENAVEYSSNHTIVYWRNRGFQAKPIVFTIYDYSKMNSKDIDSTLSRRFVLNQLIKYTNLSEKQMDFYKYIHQLSKMNTFENHYYLQEKHKLNQLTEKYMIEKFESLHCHIEKEYEDSNNPMYLYTLKVYV